MMSSFAMSHILALMRGLVKGQGLHLCTKTPVGAGNIFLRHRQACQKLRKTSPAPTGLLRVITGIDFVYIVARRTPGG